MRDDSIPAVFDADLDLDDELDFDPDAPVSLLPPLPARAPSVLVVEDDPDTASRCVRSLRAIGMRPVVTPTCDEAIERLAQDGSPFAVIYADVRHADVAAAARRLRPSARRLFATDEIGDVLTGAGVVLCRPFTADEFRTAFDAALLDEDLPSDARWVRGGDAVWPEDALRRTA